LLDISQLIVHSSEHNYTGLHIGLGNRCRMNRGKTTDIIIIVIIKIMRRDTTHGDV